MTIFRASDTRIDEVMLHAMVASLRPTTDQAIASFEVPAVPRPLYDLSSPISSLCPCLFRC